jgi:hypothetical protein
MSASWSKTDHAAMDIHPRNRLPVDHHIHQEYVDKFCDELTAHDPWMWREACNRIRVEIDYNKTVSVVYKRPLDPTARHAHDTYTIWATLKSGQSIEMHRGEAGWHIEYGKPVDEDRS